MVADAKADSENRAGHAVRHAATGEPARRFGLFLCDCHDAATLDETLSRIPDDLGDGLLEIVVMLDRPTDGALPKEMERLRQSRPDLKIHRPPHDSGFGAIRKAAFEYARLMHFDHVIIMGGDGTHPPEQIPTLIELALSDPDRFILATSRRPEQLVVNTYGYIFESY